jgi:PAS domain S-box-containing protein
MIFINRRGRIVYANKKCEEIMGYQRADLYSEDFDFRTLIAAESSELVRSLFEGYMKGREADPYDCRLVTKSGRRIDTIITTTLMNYEGSIAILGIITDITERKRLEAQLFWSQKMETVGRLAGGVAHDFNNILTTIRSYVELGMMHLHPEDPLNGNFQEILKASDRAANLTTQLLAFSRRQRTEKRVISLNEAIRNMEKMLRRLIGENIELVTRMTKDLGRVKADVGQVEQVIVNLCVNARDAMPEGGRLTLSTANVTFGEQHVRRHVWATPGRRVMLAVSDTGVGLTEEVKAHLFEPFYTTKELGKGTGLGLATSYGIVRQNRGNITATSKPGKGTTFKIYFPRVDEEPEPLPMPDESGDPPRGSERVLLVEDDPSVRKVTVQVLSGQGYTVLEAPNGEEALRVARNDPEGEIHLLMTDVVMPRMSGVNLANLLREERPGLRVLFFSGYTGDGLDEQSLRDPDVAFLQKPFSPATLARTVYDLLRWKRA